MIPAAAEMETTTRLSFHGVAYVVTVGVREQTLEVQVEIDELASDPSPAPPPTNATAPSTTTPTSTPAGPQKAPSTITANADFVGWTGSFPATYVEDLTRKTGNYKRFPVFVNMLLSAMSHRSDAVFIDLLTTADLELYRKRKFGRSGGGPLASSSASASSSIPTMQESHDAPNKRYLILTYAVEFDRVHYPLPLSRVETPTPTVLQRTIRRLKQALVSATTDSKRAQLEEELAILRDENRCLKNTLKEYCGGSKEPLEDWENQGDRTNRRRLGGDAASLDLKKELEASILENKELVTIYEQLQKESHAEISRLRAEIKHLRVNQDSGVTDHERAETRRILNESSAATAEALDQLKDMKRQLQESQMKNRELLRQLAIERSKSVNESPLQEQRFLRQPRASSNVFHPARRSSAHNRTPRTDNESEDEEHIRVVRSPPSRSQRRPYRRFDPTAYQQERLKKQQERQQAARSRSPSPAPLRPRRRQSFNANGGYASDSSAGGYSSAGSNASKNSRSTVRSRGRSRVAYERQREVDARLASPRSKAQLNDNSTPPRSQKSPLPRPVQQIRGRSQSPARTSVTNSSTPSSRTRPPLQDRAPTANHRRQGQESPASALTNSSNAMNGNRKPQRITKRKPAVTLLADTSLDSFSDIDDRLTALQQFLREAKQGKTIVGETGPELES